MIKELIHKAIKQEERAPRDYLGASAIGNQCERAIWYGYKGEKSEFDPKTLITFEIGKHLERMLLGALLEIGVTWFTKPYFSETVAKFQGTPDAHIKIDGVPYLLEIKTANNANFSRMAKQGIRATRPDYYDQVQSYMGMSGYGNCIFLVINKDSSELYEELIESDPIHYEVLEMKAKRIIESMEPPKKLNESPLFYLCRMCAYRRVCHG